MKYIITLLVIIATMYASTAFADKNDNASAKLADLAELENRLSTQISTKASVEQYKKNRNKTNRNKKEISKVRDFLAAQLAALKESDQAILSFLDTIASEYDSFTDFITEVNEQQDSRLDDIELLLAKEDPSEDESSSIFQAVIVDANGEQIGTWGETPVIKVPGLAMPLAIGKRSNGSDIYPSLEIQYDKGSQAGCQQNYQKFAFAEAVGAVYGLGLDDKGQYYLADPNNWMAGNSRLIRSKGSILSLNKRGCQNPGTEYHYMSDLIPLTPIDLSELGINTPISVEWSSK